MANQRLSSATRNVPALSPSTSSLRPRSGSGSASSTSRSASATARPFSSTNLSATVATSRFKTFAVQYEILCKNAILCELAKEVPWKNLLDLFTLKFYAVGDVLWRHGDHPMELAFVLCGGFLVRNMKEEPNDPHDGHHYHSRTHGTTTHLQERAESIVAEKLLKPGASLAAHAVDQGGPIHYTVLTAKFKSILIALPIGKFKSVMRQLTPGTKAAVQHLILESETKLCVALKLTPPKAPRASTAPSPRNLRRPGSPLKKSASTPAMALHSHSHPAAVDPTVTALNKAIHTASWDSLQVAQPVEYEVNSSLLILHDSSSGAKLHVPSTGHSAGEHLRAKLMRGSSSSSVIRTTAKKHTTRRLQSIKLPAGIEAFPPQPKRDRDIEAEALADASFSGSHSLDVVPKVRIGRLLAPIKKPAMVEHEGDVEPWTRPHTITKSGSFTKDRQAPLAGRLILLADRDKKFREEL